MQYLHGFGNYHSTEAVTGALPQNQNNPQHCPLGLFAEQLSGSAFTKARHQNLKSWLYREYPSATQNRFALASIQPILPFAPDQSPNPYRWSPPEKLSKSQDFAEGLTHLAGNKLANLFWYQCNRSMTTRYLSNRDGEYIFIPFDGAINLHTELGSLTIAPKQIAVIPRGIFFKIELVDNVAAGYLCENLATPLSLPTLGFMGANALAHPRHFCYPTAAFEKGVKEATLLVQYQQRWWQMSSEHTPLNVIAWHGNYAPYCYDLTLFNTLNTVSFDHPDPSIFTVLTSESDTSGVANLDFVIFPERWTVAEHTFRPPYFHRNLMNELMGLIEGQYDAKPDGFNVGGLSIHNCMTPHGPDYASYQKAISQKLTPEHYSNTLAFMFESRLPWQLTYSADKYPSFQSDYADCWGKLRLYANK